MRSNSTFNDKSTMAGKFTTFKDNSLRFTQNAVKKMLNNNTLYFDNLQEYEILKAKRSEFQERINIRLDYEKAYILAKKDDMDRELNDIKFKNDIAFRRNDELLNDIQKNVFRIYQSSKNSNYSKELLYKERKKYDEYSQYQLNSIKKEFFSRIQMKQHEILNLKTVFETQIDKNEEMFKLENLYNERMKNMLNDFSDNMNFLNERNIKIANEREEIIKNYINLENKTYEAIHKIMEENKKVAEDKNLGMHANDFEKLVEKCINKINENLNKATSNVNNPKNITILIENNTNNKQELNNQNLISINEKNLNDDDKNIFTTEIKNDINLVKDINNLKIIKRETNLIQNNFENQNNSEIPYNQITMSHLNFDEKKELNLKNSNINNVNENYINNTNLKVIPNITNNKASKESLNPQLSNDTIIKKKKKIIHPSEVLDKILRSNSKKNLENSQSQSKSNTLISNNYDEGKKNILRELNNENNKINPVFESYNSSNINKNLLSNDYKIQENIKSEENFNNQKSITTANNFISNENKSTSKTIYLNNTEDYVRGKNISGITNEMLNQIDVNHTVNGNKINECKCLF